MKLKGLLSTLLFITFYSGLVSGQNTFKGVVKDNETGDPIIGASVVIKGTTEGMTTDLDGNFAIQTNRTPPFTIVVSFMGYENTELDVSSFDSKIKVNLSTKKFEIKTVEVVDTRLTEKQKQAPQTVETMDAISIKETPSADFYEGLGHLKGVDVTSASIGFKVINTRGFNSTSPVRSLQLIDGVDNQSPGLNFSLGNFLGASELDIKKVELVVGANGALFGPNAFNGVINMQTKDPFLFPGLSVLAKVGERNLYQTAVRYAKSFKDKNDKDRFGFKL
ncbi:MAG: TonB-dependent receptor, partial [Flavobacteriales bacterium]|nr:TonB-dependent receptor [Flavobacteriales bacterium]